MFAIIKKCNKYALDNIIFDINLHDFFYKEINIKDLTELKSNYFACFIEETSNFYYCNYNNNSDFEIGIYSDIQDITSANFDKINIQKYLKSPFEFYEKVVIEEFDFIFGTNNIYYKLKNDKDKFYYGIFDVILNKIIFNTDEEILKFIPHSDKAMLAITKNSAYKICTFRDATDCVYCNNQNFILDSSNYNFCGNNCITKYIFIPNNICTDICNQTIFSIKNNKECGLCKDLYYENPFKFYNQSGCIKDKPDNSFYVNEELKIIDCDKNYKYENGKCIQKCHEFCDKCITFSFDNNDQRCISCKNGLFLQDGNCIQNCSNNYFLNDNKCEKCDNNCKTCNQTSRNCTSCIKGKYLDIISEIHTCKNCNDICATCVFNEDNCSTCDKNSSFKLFFNYSFYEKCPRNTKMNIINYTCEEIKNDIDKSTKKIPVMLVVFSIISGSLLILIIFFYIKRNMNKNKKSSEFFMNEINRELREN